MTKYKYTFISIHTRKVAARRRDINIHKHTYSIQRRNEKIEKKKKTNLNCTSEFN